jgi:hypothetical protein
MVICAGAGTIKLGTIAPANIKVETVPKSIFFINLTLSERKKVE